MGRFCVWGESAFKKLDSIFGTWRKASEEKSNYKSVFYSSQSLIDTRIYTYILHKWLIYDVVKILCRICSY